MRAKIVKPALGSEGKDLERPRATKTFSKLAADCPAYALRSMVLLGILIPLSSTLSIAQEVRTASDANASVESAPPRSSNQAARSKKTRGEGTRVSVPIDLEALHRRGGVPSSLDILRSMERQQQRVAQRAAKCTVSVKIGAAQGCGVIVSDDGYIVTAAHVATRPGLKAIVTLSGGRQVAATTLGMNREVDAGLIRINPEQNGGKSWPHASLGASDDLVPGMWCIAMGHPGGYQPSRGPVIRVGRLLEVRNDVVVSDCALIGGDSGGPLFNMAGELIAVHSRIGNDVSENLHVPIVHYDYSWQRMARGESWGHLPNFKPTLGVSGNRSTKDATIIEVKKGSPAEAGGMRPGDIVVRFGRKQVTDFESLIDAVADTMPGERVRIVVLRADLRVDLLVEIGRSS